MAFARSRATQALRQHGCFLSADTTFQLHFGWWLIPSTFEQNPDQNGLENQLNIPGTFMPADDGTIRRTKSNQIKSQKHYTTHR
jgi:hypothetical protein